MNDPDWAKVLNYLYEGNSIEYRGDGLDESHELVAKLGIPPREIHDLLHEMRDLDLVEFKTEQMSEQVVSKYVLHKDGFDVAHDREMNRNTQRTNIGIGVLTVFLVAGSLLQGYAAFLSQSGLFNRGILLTILVVSLTIGVIVVGVMIGENPRDVLDHLF